MKETQGVTAHLPSATPILTLSYVGGASDHPLCRRGRPITRQQMMPESARTIFS